MNLIFIDGRLVGAEDDVAGDESHGEEHVSTDDKGIVTHDPMLPETAEIIYGGLASLIIFALLIKFAGPAIRKGLAKRTARIQGELDAAATARRTADTEAAQIRQAKGDIQAERARIMADVNTQAEALIADGRVRLDEEITELRSRAAADLAAARGRGTDELRAEITQLSVAAADRAVAQSIDPATQQQLIESFIQRVGASA